MTPPSSIRHVIMEFVSTGIVVAIVATLMLLGIAMVVNQLLRLRKWLNASPPDPAPDDEAG
jgi:uncharacterized membrane protein YdbT with pleckstrin-like domain